MSDLKKELEAKLAEAKLKEQEAIEKVKWHDHQMIDLNKEIMLLGRYIISLQGVLNSGNF